MNPESQSTWVAEVPNSLPSTAADPPLPPAQSQPPHHELCFLAFLFSPEAQGITRGGECQRHMSFTLTFKWFGETRSPKAGLNSTR